MTIVFTFRHPLKEAIQLPLNSKLIWSYCCLIIFAISACDKNRLYEKNISIDKYEWDSHAIPQYEVEIKDTSTLYNIYINVRHADAYPFQNLWLLIGTRLPDSTSASKRIEITLADEDGKWYGEGLGDIWDYQSMIQENAFFNETGTYIFSVEQNMRQDPLPGIMAIGIRIENTGIKKRSLPEK